MKPAAPLPGQPTGDPVPGWQARPAPGPVTLTGSHVTLEPLSSRHFQDLYAATCGPGDDGLWTYLFSDKPTAPADHAALMTQAVEETDVTFALIPRDDGPAGRAKLMRVDRPNGVLEVGNIIYGRALQQTPAATEAMWLLMRHVFDDLGYRRYEWKLDCLNTASAAAARRLGFTYEGRFRQAVVYKGRNRDTDWFAVTDDDFERLRPAYEQWLDPGNFDDRGRQRISLSVLTGVPASTGVPG